MKYYLTALLVVFFITGCATSPADKKVNPVYGETNPDTKQKASAKVKMFASVIELIPEKELQYRQLHADVWPEVKAAVKKANIRNYSIFLTEVSGKKYLFSYMEYTGEDIEKDFAQLAQNPTVRQKWWPLTDSSQKRLEGTPDGQQWKPMEMIMHIP